jgi:hypothetical protein
VPPPAQLVDTVAEHLAQPLDVVEDAGVEVVVELALRLQLGREPGIVRPVGSDDDGALGLLVAQEVVDRVDLARRVPRGPDFRTCSAISRTQTMRLPGRRMQRSTTASPKK